MNSPINGGSRIFLGGGALVSCSTSTPINHIVFFFCRIPVVFENRRSSQGGGGGVRTPCALSLDPPLPIRNCLAGNSPPLQVVAYQQTFSYEKPFSMATAYCKDVKIAFFFFSVFNVSLVLRKRIGRSNVELEANERKQYGLNF